MNAVQEVQWILIWKSYDAVEQFAGTFWEKVFTEWLKQGEVRWSDVFLGGRGAGGVKP